MNIARDGYPTGPLADSDTNNPGQYFQATFNSTGQNTDGTNRIPCPASTGCEGNFGDTSLDNDPTVYMNWYDVPTTNVGGYVAVEFGYHETWQYYLKRCMLTSRNKGLYTADQQINGFDARFARQSPNGNRDGFECTEERDYYPWWGVSPWRDIAVLVSHADNWQQQCAYYKQESQNVKGRSYCKKVNVTTLITTGVDLPLDKDKCINGNPDSTGTIRYSLDGVSWVDMPSFGLPAPDCLLHPMSRDNHLGNAVAVTSSGNMYTRVADVPNPASYTWQIPEGLNGLTCVVRIRYNLSSSDYPQSNWNNPNFVQATGETAREKIFWDSRYNCPANTDTTALAGVMATGIPSYCQNVINDTTGYVPIFERAYVNVSTGPGYPLLALAFQTDQVARTFEDRSYVLTMADYPNRNGRIIYNLNNRGRRGNIVQCYPAVENDFYPVDISMGSNQLLHIQFCGSDFNPNNNPNNGEGWQYSTRFNIIAHSNKMLNVPKVLKSGSYVFGDGLKDLAVKLAFANLTDPARLNNGTMIACVNYQGDNSNTANNMINNCAKLNPSNAHVDYGVYSMPVGSYKYVSTRNNNFSNRSNKGTLSVFLESNMWTAAAIAGVTIGSFVGLVAIGAAAAVFYAKKNPNSRIAAILSRKKDNTITATHL